jgi:hypothetical protein
LALGAILCFIVLSPPWHCGGIREEQPLIAERPSNQDIIAQYWSITAVDEYLPKWVKEKWPEEFPAQEARTIDPSGKATVSRGANGTWLISVDQPGEGYVVLGQYWFPGWRLEQNGNKALAGPQDSYGLIEFQAPAGQSQFTLSRGRTAMQKAGDSISIAALLFCIGLLAVRVAFMRRRVSAG